MQKQEGTSGEEISYRRRCDAGCTCSFIKRTGKQDDTEQICSGPRHIASGLCLTDQTCIQQRTHYNHPTWVVFPLWKLERSQWCFFYHPHTTFTCTYSRCIKMFINYWNYFLGGKIFLFGYVKSRKWGGPSLSPRWLYLEKMKLHGEGERVWGHGVWIRRNSSGC